MAVVILTIDDAARPALRRARRLMGGQEHHFTETPRPGGRHMSTETDEVRVEATARPLEPGMDWSGDEAAGGGLPFPEGSVAAAYSGQSAGGDEPRSDGRPLVDAETQKEFLTRWNEIQVSFVDDPGTAAESAYALTGEIVAVLRKSLKDRSRELADGWHAASDTEQLRLALMRFRSFIDVILPA
jgi:hypothetical protein